MFIGMGTEVVERLVTPNMIIKRCQPTFESASVEKQNIKEIVVPFISDNSSLSNEGENELDMSQEKRNSEIQS